MAIQMYVWPSGGCAANKNKEVGGTERDVRFTSDLWIGRYP